MFDKPTYHELENQIAELQKQNEILRLHSSTQKEEEREYYSSNTLNYISDPVFIKDDQSRLLIVNDAFCELFGLSRVDIIGKTLAENVTPEEWEIFLKIDKEVIADGVKNINEESLTVRGGETRTISTRKTRFIDSEGEKFLVGIIRDITDRKKAEEELKDSEKRIPTIFTYSPIPIALTRAKDNQLIDVNKAWLDLTGYNKDEVIGIPTQDLNIAVKSSQEKIFAEMQANGRVKGSDFQLRKKNGEIADLLFSAELVELGSEKIILSMTQDITKRKQAEEELKSLSSIVEQSTEGMALVDMNGNLTFANKAWCEMHGYKSFKSLIGKNLAVFHSKAQIENDVIPFNEKVNKYGTYSGEVGHISKDGKPFPTLMTSSIIKDQQDIPIAIAGIAKNITERKQAEQALKESEEKYRTFTFNIPGMTYRGGIDWSTEIVTNLEEVSGYSIDEWDIQEMNWLNLIHPDDKQAVFKGGTKLSKNTMSMIQEYRIIHKDENIRWVRDYKTSLFKDDGTFIGIDGVVFDITEQKTAELKLKASEQKLKVANATKDKFFSIIAHDLRSPFNQMLGFSELLIEKVNSLTVSEREKYLYIINSTAKNTLVLLDNLLNWAKSQTGQVNFKPEKVVLSSIIQEIFELSNSSAKNKNILLNHIQSEEIVVLADLNMIKAVLRNLISNAIKFTNSNGKINVYTLQNDKFIEIAVSDNGVGINKETQNKLFRIETNKTTIGTANEKGSGLGLILCKEFVEKHGGIIWVESEVGKGSCFYFTLPYQTQTIKENSAINEISSADEVIPINRLKILIAEDDETSKMLISIYVKEFSDDIISVRTGTEAVSKCFNNPDIDLILMDILMPEMDGFEAIQQIRKFNKDVVIIAQTAYGLEGDREKAIALGCDDYIAKPIKANELKRMIIKYLKKHD